MRSQYCPFLLVEELEDPFYGAEGGAGHKAEELCEYFEVSIGYLTTQSMWGRRPRLIRR
jgi:hypothetical protein